MSRLLFFPVTMLLALAAGCAPADSQAEAPRTVSVSGQGEVRAVPDMAILQFGIEARGKDLPALQARAGQTMADFLALCAKLGIPDKQVQTSQVLVEPRYHWNEGQQIFDGYHVTRMITLRLEALEQLGPLLEQAVALGVNSVSPPQLGSSRAKTLQREALVKAAADARAQATLLAQELGAELGPVRQISAGGQPPVAYRERSVQFASVAAADAGQTYQPGEITFEASVQTTFDLETP